MPSSIMAHDLLRPYEATEEFGQMTLRDGSVAQVRIARPGDSDALAAFFARLSPEARQRRFLSAALPPANLVASFCDDRDPRSALTLLVMRRQDGESRIIATASYLAKNETTAEAAFAVDDAFQGKGLGTLLLERLALLAVRQGFTHFWALTQADNRAMRDVFRESGFVMEEIPDLGEVEVDLSILPSEASVARLETRHRVATMASLRPFFHPKSVAVVGASRDPAGIGHRVLDALLRGGFSGPIYPINPRAGELCG